MLVSLWFPYPPMSSYQHLSYTLCMWTSKSSPKLNPGSSSSWAMWPQHFSMETQQIEDAYMIFFQHVSFVKMVNRLKFCLSKIPWRSLNHLSQKSQLDLSSECQVLSTKSWWDACAEKTFRCAPVGISQTNDSVIVEHFAKLRISSNPATFTTKLNYWQHSPQSITRLVSATGQEPTVCFGQRPCNGPKKLVMYTLRFEMPTNSLNPKRFMFTRKRTHQTLMVFYKIYQKTNPDHIRISMSNFLDSEQLSSPGPSLFASLFLIA